MNNSSAEGSAPLPRRIQLSRRKGWKMPANTIVVARPTPWGNPFKIGVDGNAARSVELYHTMLAGYYCISCKTDFDVQKKAVAYARKNIRKLRGKNLACWCAIADRHGKTTPCHADVLLSLANDIPLEDVIRENLRRAKGETV